MNFMNDINKCNLLASPESFLMKKAENSPF